MNHPKDPGGATNFGITQRTYDAYLSELGEKSQDVRNITMHTVFRIYKLNYWDKLKRDRLAAWFDHVVMDAGVTAGASRAAPWRCR